MNKNQVFLTVIYAGIPLILAVFLFISNVPVGGKIYQTYEPNMIFPQKMITAPYPANRIDNVVNRDGQVVLPLINDNAYFDILFPPLSFDNISLDVNFFRPDSVTEINLGIPRGPEQFERVILTNEQLDKLTWSKIGEGYLTLWQKEPQYESISEFLSQPPTNKVTAVHDTAPTPQLIIPDYKPRRQTIPLPVALQGPHSLFTYLADENLYLKLKTYSPADITTEEFIRVLDFQGRELQTYQLPKNDFLEINIPDLSAGLYRLEITLDPESILSDLETSLSKLVARNTLSLAPNPLTNSDAPGLSINLQGSNLAVQTSSPEGRQIITAAGKELYLNESNRKIFWRQFYPELDKSGQMTISLERTPVRLTANGYFSLGRNDLVFNPEPSYTFKLSSDTTAEQLGAADFVIAKYIQPQILGNGLISASIELPLSPLFKEKDTATFGIFTPGLDRDCEQIYLQKIDVTLTRPALSWAEIKRLGVKLFTEN